MSLKFGGCIHYTVSSTLGWVLQHTAADLPVVAGVSSAVCVPGPGPAPGHSSPGSHQHQVLLLIAIIAAQWLSPVCRLAIEARHYEARLRSFLLFSWNRWIIDWRIWSSGRLCLVTAALRRWGSGNTAVIAIVTETKLDLFTLFCECYENYFITAWRQPKSQLASQTPGNHCISLGPCVAVNYFA